MTTALIPHTSHLNGLSPVCVLMCVYKLLLWLHPLPHTSQLYDLSPVCVLIYIWGDVISCNGKKRNGMILFLVLVITIGISLF